MKLKDEIIKEGIENCVFMIKMRPVKNRRTKYVKVPAVIVEEKYKVKDGYKIELKSLTDGYGSHTFYQSDLEVIIEDGHAQMLINN